MLLLKCTYLSRVERKYESEEEKDYLSQEYGLILSSAESQELQHGNICLRL